MSIWKKDCILLGHQGDNLQTDVTVDVTPILARWPNAYIEVAVKRPTETTPYLAVTHVADNRLVWHVTASDTEIAGYGEAELIALDGERIAYSCTVITKIRPAMEGIAQEDPPEPAEAWVQQVAEAGAAAQEALETAQTLLPTAQEALAAAQQAETNTETLALLAQQSANEAAASAETSERYARLSEMSAEHHGFCEFSTDDRGHLIYRCTETFDDVIFELVNGRLVYSYGN